jgi:hypothetical protein
MSEIKDCREMELWCLQRARTEPENHWKWVGQAEKWRDLAHSQIAFNFQKTSHKQMHAWVLPPRTEHGPVQRVWVGARPRSHAI